MKKRWRKGLLLLLAVSLFLGQGVTALARWDGAVTVRPGEYLRHSSVVEVQTDYIKVFQLEAGESPVLPLESFQGYPSFTKSTYLYTPLESKAQADFSSPVPYRMMSPDGKKVGLCWLLARPYGGVSTWTKEEKQALLDLAPDILACRDRLIRLLAEMDAAIEQRKVEIGGVQTAYQPLIHYVRNYTFWSFTDDNEVPAYGQTEVLFTVESLQEELKSSMESPRFENSLLKADQMKGWLMCTEALCEEMENRIDAPELTGFQLGDYKGIVDGTSHVTLTVPEGANLPDPREAVVETAGSVWANFFAGSLENGQLLYRLTPWASWTGELYDGRSDYSFGTDLGKTWIVEIKRGDPVLQVQEFSVTLGERTYRARIDEEAGVIRLTLPLGTELTSLTPVLRHTAAQALINGQAEGTAVNLSQPGKVMLTLDTYSREYDLEVETGDSAECEILSYTIDGQKGSINGDHISLTLPYGTDLSAESAQVTVSEDAKLIQEPQELAYDTPLTYVVQAQNQDTRTYTVTLTQTPISHENQLLSFSYGSAGGLIDQNQGTVVLDVPEGTDLKRLTPTVRVSEFASVYPASGEAVDFSGTEPVTYTVTSQSGLTNTYTVRINLVAAGENPHKTSMERLLNNIIGRYETAASDDWEWMNLGFYQHITRTPSPDALPEGLNLHARLKKLDTASGVAMTDFDRTIMMLTALGIDASKLDQYTTEDEPFVDSKGNVITDLTACLYNFSGGYTINGPIFALIALDMGNYTIPENAVWTREKLLETILAHSYGTDGFGVDMVGMLMQSIAPYQNDPVYGERVRAKLEEGIRLFLGQSKAPTVDAMQPDFTFGGFGYQSSESAAQAVCALCAAGVDCHTDARFSDGGGKSALTAFLDYADGEYFAHTMDVQKNAMATYQGCYTVQWYLKFLEGGGAGHPASLYYHQQDFSRPLSTEAEILKFVLEGKEGEIDGDQIFVTLPKGTPLTDMKPELTLSEYASLEAPTLPVTFSENAAQPFTVRAEDGVTTRTYYVTVTLSDDPALEASGSSLNPDSLKLQDAGILRDLEITARKVTKTDGITDILLNVSAGVDPTNLFIKGDISYGATTEPADILNGKTKVNLSGWNTILVKAQDGEHVSTYRIKVEVQETAAIESFSVVIDGTVYRGMIDNMTNKIQVLGVPSDADVTKLAPDITLSEGTNVCSPLSGVPQNFSVTVSYTVSGDGMASRVYAVDILDSEGRRPTGSGGSTDVPEPGTPDTPVISAAKITAFSLMGVDGVIDEEAGTIQVTLPEGTDLSHAAPKIAVESGCTVSPVSGETVDLRSPRVYTVTNGTDTTAYTVIVILEKTVSQQLWEKLEDENTITDHQVVRD